MNRTKIAAIAGLTALVLVAPAALSGGCTDNGCEDATKAMKNSIKTVCAEEDFRATPFCTCCVPNGYFSIDDTCACKQLVFDADFCFYESDESGFPSVRSALVHALEVCENRQVRVPDLRDAGPLVCRGESPPVVAEDAGTQ